MPYLVRKSHADKIKRKMNPENLKKSAMAKKSKSI